MDSTGAKPSLLHRPLLIIWPRAQAYTSLIEREVQKYFRQIPPNFSFSVSQTELERVVQLVYADARYFALPSAARKKTREEWARGSREGEIRVFICPEGSQKEVYRLKNALREFWSDSWGGVHTTDRSDDSFQILTTLADPIAFSIVASSPTILLRENLRYISRLPAPPPLQETTSAKQWVLGGDAVGKILLADRRNGWRYELRRAEANHWKAHHLNVGSASSILERMNQNVPRGSFWFAGKIINLPEQSPSPSQDNFGWSASLRSKFIALRVLTIAGHFDYRLSPATGKFGRPNGQEVEAFLTDFPWASLPIISALPPTEWPLKFFLRIATKFRLRVFMAVATLRTIVNIGPQWLRDFVSFATRLQQPFRSPNSRREGLEV